MTAIRCWMEQRRGERRLGAAAPSTKCHLTRSDLTGSASLKYHVLCSRVFVPRNRNSENNEKDDSELQQQEQQTASAKAGDERRKCRLSVGGKRRRSVGNLSLVRLHANALLLFLCCSGYLTHHRMGNVYLLTPAGRGIKVSSCTRISLTSVFVSSSSGRIPVSTNFRIMSSPKEYNDTIDFLVYHLSSAEVSPSSGHKSMYPKHPLAPAKRIPVVPPPLRDIASKWNRKRTAAIPRLVCSFCRKNGETRQLYSSHVLKDAAGIVVCPVLRKYKCPICDQVGGDFAHTKRFCPLNPDQTASQGKPIPEMLKDRPNSTGKRCRSN